MVPEEETLSSETMLEQKMEKNKDLQETLRQR
jgi:hypothetical protein